MSAEQPSRDFRLVGLWAVTAVLAMVFLWVGLTKLVATELFEAHFARWGLPVWLIWLSGAIETTGAVLILITPMAAVGAGLLALSAAGATVVHLIHGELLMSVLPALLAGAATVVAYLRRGPLLAASPSRFVRTI